MSNFFYIIFDHGIDYLDNICKELTNSKIKINKLIYLNLPIDKFNEYMLNLYPERDIKKFKNYILGKANYIKKNSKNKKFVRSFILLVSIDNFNGSPSYKIQLTKKKIRNLYNPKLKNINQQIAPLDKGVSHNHIIHSSDYQNEMKQIYYVISKYSEFEGKKVIIKEKNNDFGSQYLSIIACIAYCNYNNYYYVHKPIFNNDMNSLNEFIGIPNSKNIDYDEEFDYNIDVINNPNIYYTSEVLNIIRKYYYYSSKPKIDDIDIAIHIKGDDVTNNNDKSNGYISNSYYKKLIEMLLNEFTNYNITIFSDGKLKDLQNDRIRFKSNESIENTFHALVSAKILVMSKSSFSYSAALLNKNIIYYVDFWHKPLDFWKILPKDY